MRGVGGVCSRWCFFDLGYLKRMGWEDGIQLCLPCIKGFTLVDFMIMSHRGYLDHVDAITAHCKYRVRLEVHLSIRVVILS